VVFKVYSCVPVSGNKRPKRSKKLAFLPWECWEIWPIHNFNISLWIFVV